MFIVLFIIFTSQGLVKTTVTDHYIAAVVEYTSPYLPDLSPDDVLIYNALKYVEFMTNASQNQVDVIVFPEGGLTGPHERRSYVEIPSPLEGIAPCDHEDFHQALVLISCASRRLAMYTVVNLSEKQSTETYNTNVAFDRQGIVVARYRKFNTYGENVNHTAVPEHSYFDTDFGVRFGTFTCFDIDFDQPALYLATTLGIKHFVFPHCWQSELPFLTAIQTQWGWAYSLDVVLLASGCNSPLLGGTGSGIYLGKQGPLITYQTNMYTSAMIIAEVPLQLNCTAKPNTTVLVSEDIINKNSSLSLLRDYLDVYETELLFNDVLNKQNLTGQEVDLNQTFTIDTTLCDADFCCHFEVQVTALLSVSPPPTPTRGDDFTSSVYRLAVFNGVRSYGGGVATGGVQVCGVVSCLNMSLSSCGLRSDLDHVSSPLPDIYEDGHDLYKITTTFNFIYISAEFFYNNTFVFPDVLVSGKGEQFGSLISTDQILFEQFEPYNKTRLCRLRVNTDIPNLVTAAIYARQFDKDGLPRTTTSSTNIVHVQYAQHISTIMLALLLLCLCSSSS